MLRTVPLFSIIMQFGNGRVSSLFDVEGQSAYRTTNFSNIVSPKDCCFQAVELLSTRNSSFLKADKIIVTFVFVGNL